MSSSSLARLTFCLALLLVACKLDLENGVLLCNHQGKPCPDGYHCAADDYCYHSGTDPDLSAQVIDLATSGDLRPDLFDLSEPNDLLSGPDLFGIKQKGDSCLAGVDTCATGHCVDGYCCESDCTESCRACDVSGMLGTCAPVSGPPHGSRSCNGSGTCGGTCSGTSTCSYPPASVICGAACDGHCDGNGTCSAATGGSCANGFACGSNACLTACSIPADCVTNFTCQAPNCVRVPESDCLDGIDNNGDGKTDCQDPTCTTVECVPAVSAGDEVGVFTSGSCPADYGAAETFHQTLVVPTCSGCGCNATITCTATAYASTVDNACTGKSSWGAVTAQEYNGGSVGFPCTEVGTAIVVKSIYWSAPFRSAPTTTVATGSGSAANAYWDPVSTMNFCPARNSASCPVNQLCVRKRAPAAPVCARVPGVAQGCPGGYTSGATDTWYTGIMDSHTCGSCGSCTVGAQGDCAGIIEFAFLSANACSGSPIDLDFGIVAFGNGVGPICDPTQGSRAARSIYPTSLGAEGATCSCSSSIINPATRTGGSTICCQ